METVQLIAGTSVNGSSVAGHVFPITLHNDWEVVHSGTIMGCTITGIRATFDIKPSTIPVAATTTFAVAIAARWDDRQTANTAPGATLDGLRSLAGTSTKYGPWIDRHVVVAQYQAAGTQASVNMIQQPTPYMKFRLRGTVTDEQKVPVLYVDNLTNAAVDAVTFRYWITVDMLLP